MGAVSATRTRPRNHVHSASGLRRETVRLRALRMTGPVICVYHAYDGDELVATGRLPLERLPSVGDELRLNGRLLVVRDVAFSGDSHVLTLERLH